MAKSGCMSAIAIVGFLLASDYMIKKLEAGNRYDNAKRTYNAWKQNIDLGKANGTIIEQSVHIDSFKSSGPITLHTNIGDIINPQGYAAADALNQRDKNGNTNIIAQKTENGYELIRKLPEPKNQFEYSLMPKVETHSLASR